MQRRDQQSPKAGWRKSTRQASTTTTKTPEFGVQGRSRRKLTSKISIGATLAVSLVAMFIYLVLIPPDDDVPMIVAAVTESSRGFYVPPNPFAEEDVELWEEWFKDDPDGKQENRNVAFYGLAKDRTGEMEVGAEESTSDRDPNSTGRIGQLMVQGIEQANSGGPDDNMIALCITAQGVLDRTGQPYLLVGNSRADDKSTWISVKDLLDKIDIALKEKGTGCRAVLFLDANRAGTIWDWGKLDNSFVKQCKTLAREYPERLAIILSCQDGERSWWDPKRGYSLFARAIVEALAGHQDVDTSRFAGGGVITVDEIVTFLQRQVARDASKLWNASQHPTLLSSESKDWKVVGTPDWPQKFSKDYADQVDRESERRVGELKRRFAELERLWERHNQLRDQNHSPLTTDPLQWSILEKRLARLDQLAIAGASDANYKGVKRECEKLMNRFEKGSSVVNSAKFPELRLARYFHTSDGTENPEFEKIFFDDWAPKPDVNNKPFGIEQDPDGEAKLLPPLWKWLIDDETFRKASVQTASKLLDEYKIGRPARFLETHLIRLVTADDLQVHVGEFEADNVLKLHHRSRDAAFPPDVRASFWIRHEARSVNEARMRLTDQILGKKNSSQREVAGELKGIDGDLQELVSKGMIVSEAYRLRDQMLHEIPRIAETLLSDKLAFLDRSSDIDALFRQATDATQNLTSQLQLVDVADAVETSDIDTSEIAARIQSIVSATENARGQLDELWKILNRRADEAGGESQGDGDALRKGVAMLNGSGLNEFTTRDGIYDRLGDLIDGLNSRPIQSDRSDDEDENDEEGENDDEDENEADDVDGDRGGDETANANNNTHPWIYWLNQIKDSDPDLDRQDESEELIGTLIEQGGLIRSAQNQLQNEKFDDVRQQPEKLSSVGERANSLAKVRHDVAELDTRLRSQLFLLDRPDKEIDVATSDRFKLDVQLFLMDHASRTMYELWCEARDNTKEQPYFGAATRDLLKWNAFPVLKSRNLDGVQLQDQLAALQQAWQSPDTLLAHSTQKFRDINDVVDLDEVEFAFRVPKSFPNGKVAAYGEPKKRDLVETKRNVSNDPNQEALVDIPVPKALLKSTNQFKVHTFFRGLRRQGSLNPPIRGIPDTVRFELPKYGSPTAFVSAEKEFSNIMLVFDCSISMEKNGRMHTARTAINQFINGLPPQSKVGLILFGHRYMWHLEDGDKPVAGPKRNGEYFVDLAGGNAGQRLVSPNNQSPAAVNPNFDVQEVAAMQELDKAHKNLLLAAINNADPFGVTPTYQAISMAYDSARGHESHIIVLTDGEPYLFPTMRSKYEKIHDDVLSIATRFQNDARIKFLAAGSDSLSIINFANLSDQSAMKAVFENPEARKIVVNANRRTLAARLEELIPKDSVRWRDKTAMAGGPEKFDLKIPVDEWPPSDSGVAVDKLVEPSKEYDVEAQLGNARNAAHVRVQGGEAFRLKWNDDRLTHDPYIVGEMQNAYDRLNPDNPSDYHFYVGNVRQEREGILNVKVVVENVDPGKFTPRPSEIWIDFVARDDDGDHRYSITLPEFVTDEQVPILQCRINNWPRVSDATVHVWAMFEGSKSQRQELSISSAEPLTIDGTTFEVETKTDEEGKFVVTVEESYRDAKDLNDFRVLPEPLPDKGMIEFYRASGSETTTTPQSNSVTRTFTYEEKPDALKLWVTNKDDFTRDAIHSSRDVRVHSQ